MRHRVFFVEKPLPWDIVGSETIIPIFLWRFDSLWVGGKFKGYAGKKVRYAFLSFDPTGALRSADYGILQILPNGRLDLDDWGIQATLVLRSMQESRRPRERSRVVQATTLFARKHRASVYQWKPRSDTLARLMKIATKSLSERVALKVCSSAGERCLDTAKAVGSTPTRPTILPIARQP